MNDRAVQILKLQTSQIPQVYMGQERTEHLSRLAGTIGNEDRLLLIKFANEILSKMIELSASDVEIGGYGCQGSVWFRVYGKKERAKDLPSLSIDETSLLIFCLLTENQKKYLLEERNLDFSYGFLYQKTGSQARFRADAYFDLDSLALNMRYINVNVRPLETLEFHPYVMKTLSHSYMKFGLSLVTGITGSGKSSTLDSIIDYHNKFDPAHIIIISSPVEYVHTSRASIVRHREVGRDVPSFKDGVIQSLRQDPDIIVIGEMRDPETILAALEVTDTGHRVFSTLHTSSAVESIDRIIAEVSPQEQDRVRNRLADVLVSVISQKLIESLDGKRVLAKEVLVVSPSVKAAIKNNNTGEIYGMINQGSSQGMVTLEQDLLRLYRSRKISKDNAMAYANNKGMMIQLLRSV